MGFDWLLGLLSAIAAIPALMLAFEVALALRRSGSKEGGNAPVRDPATRLAVIMPAHNEQAGIARSLESILEQLLPGDRLVVVADNCTDETAAIARALGAVTLERSDSQRRGKGFALAHAVDYLRNNEPPSFVVAIDADCILEKGCLAHLIHDCGSSGRPLQARYLLTGSASAAQAVSELAFRIRNWVRPLGLSTFGSPVPLQGSGMAFPWAVISGAPLASGSIIEDMALGVDLTCAGIWPGFCPDARVLSSFPGTEAGRMLQRQRWEHGQLSLLPRSVLRLIAAGWRQRSLGPIALALNLAVPPLSAYLALLGALVLIGTAALLLGASGWPLAVSAFGLCLTCVSLWMAWMRFGQDLLTPRDTLTALPYALRKLPMYVRYFFRRHREWNRAERPDQRQ
ncbi:MAG TPA: glycosyltransferase family 2 protein [Burkholderiaceae bacterium]|nr:glycosyltransferase family 2 protein [Burkholderiaceae bacterium]